MFILISINTTPPTGPNTNPPWGKSWDDCNICTLFFNHGKLEVKLIPDVEIGKKLRAKSVPQSVIPKIITDYKKLAESTNKIISAKECLVAHPVKVSEGFHLPPISPNDSFPKDSPVRHGFPFVFDQMIGDINIQSLKHVNYKDPLSKKIEPGLYLEFVPSGGTEVVPHLFPGWLSLIIIDKNNEIYYVSRD